MTWQRYFLGLIGAPASDHNVRVCDLWASSEGVLDKNNPFACSGKYPGATVCIAQCGTASEVWAYDTIEHGCEAAANFLTGSYYANVLTKFRTDAGEAAIWTAINESPWCSGCQDGKYPIDLYNYVQAHPTPSPDPPQPEDTMQHVTFYKTVTYQGAPVNAAFTSDMSTYQWVHSPAELQAVEYAQTVVDGKAPLQWNNGTPVDALAAFGSPRNKETADLVGVAFP